MLREFRALAVVGMLLIGILPCIPTVVTEFETCSGKVLALRKGGEFVDSIDENSGRVGIVLDRTCFYAEQGGQIYDTGFISVGDDVEFDVEDCQVP